jgi:photosystem I 4.8kDa protein
MASEAKPVTDAVAKTGKAPYPFRTGWALLLLAINLIVAGFYFKFGPFQ